MNLSDYYPWYYLQDYKLYTERAGGALCGHTLSIFYKMEDEILNDEKLFFLISYQLNLLNQIFYTYFQNDFAYLESTLPVFVDCRCFSQGGRPETIINNLVCVRKGELVYSESDIFEVNKYFQNNLQKWCNDISQNKLKSISDKVEAVSKECLENMRKYLK